MKKLTTKVISILIAAFMLLSMAVVSITVANAETVQATADSATADSTGDSAANGFVGTGEGSGALVALTAAAVFGAAGAVWFSTVRKENQ